MSDLLDNIDKVRDKELPRLRAEAEYPDPESGEYPTDEQVVAYIEVLESAVVGKQAALETIGKGMRL